MTGCASTSVSLTGRLSSGDRWPDSASNEHARNFAGMHQMTGVSGHAMTGSLLSARVPKRLASSFAQG